MSKKSKKKKLWKAKMKVNRIIRERQIKFLR